MASVAPPPPPSSSSQNSGPSAGGQAGAKKKNKKKKSAAAKANAAAAAAALASPEASAATAPPASVDTPGDAPDDDDADVPDNAPPVIEKSARKDANVGADAAAATSPKKPETNGNGHARQASTANGHIAPKRVEDVKDEDENSTDGADGADGANDIDGTDGTDGTNGTDGKQKSPTSIPQTTKHQDVMAKDTDGDAALHGEVERLRQQVEALQKAQDAHKEEMEQLRSELEESEAGREQAETQYQNLLGRVEKIKETLGERLKRDRQELEEAKDRIEELEGQNEGLRRGGGAAEAAAEAAEGEVARLRSELEAAERGQSSLRGRAQLAQQNWQREKEEWTRQVQQVRAELESTSGAMGEWEVIAMEERSLREGLTEKTADLEEQLAAARENSERAAEERDAEARAVDSLQRALQEIQETRKHELREMVESSEAQLEAAKTRAQTAEAAAEKAEAEMATLRSEVERTAPFEREVKEKNLLIGKLRHETIVLNDHLTKALRYIKKNKPEENVDRQVVTNHLLQFLALDRSDPKKFQILQVIAGVLNWTEEQKEKAGLARPGTSNHSLRLPTSPFYRTPSTPSLNTEFFAEQGSGSRESLADLWAGFLERSVEEAESETSGPPSRKGSLPRG